MNLKEIYEAVLKEASLSRVWQLVEEDKYDFAIISASRGKYTPQENASRFFQLKKEVNEKRLGGFVELRGGYVETDQETGVQTTVTEDSLLISGITKQNALALGAKFEQETILWKDATGFAYLSAQQGENFGKPTVHFKKGAGKDNLTLAKEVISQFFSMLKKGSHAGKKFAFVQECKFIQEREEWNWRKAMAHQTRHWYTILINE
jgi:hypothetical protein